MSDGVQSESEVERRRPDWWALESAVTERRDIVDELSDATGYFHDDDAARLREIASASGMKPVGIVKSAVEQAIENREWRCVYFDDSEERGYISSNAYEYYRIHRAFELEYEAAVEALPTEENAHLREVPVFEHAADMLEDQARKHRAKREQAERFLTENGHELPEVEDPRPESDEPELVTDGGHDLGTECDVDGCDSRVVGLDDGWEVSRGTVCQDCLDYRDRHGHWPDEDPDICVECRLDEGAIRHRCDEASVDAVILNPDSTCDYCGFEPRVMTDGGRDIDFDEPPEIPDPPMYPEWEDVETWSKANLRYPVPGGWEIADHGKFHTTWEHEDGTELTRTSKRTPGEKDTFAFRVDGQEIHSVDSGPERVEMREETVWVLQFYDENDIGSVEEFEVEVRKERNQSLDEFATDGGVDQSEAEGYQSKRIECPNCGMPFDAPDEVDHWSCDCGASWELDPRTDGGAEAFDPGDYDSVREALREAPAGYGVESIIDYFDPVVEGGHEVDVDV